MVVDICRQTLRGGTEVSHLEFWFLPVQGCGKWAWF